MEELANVLTQFKEKNPGQVDGLIPLGMGMADGFSSWIGNAEPFFGFTGYLPGIWAQKDGELVNGSIQPEMKEGLALIKQFMDEGLITEDAGTQTGDKVGELVAQGKVGAFFSNWWAGRYPGEDLKNNVENAELVPVALPTENGKAGAVNSDYRAGALLVRKDFTRMDALMAVVNKVFEWASPTDMDSEFANGFAEGYDYITKEDGTVSTNAADFPDQTQIQVHNYFLTSQITDPDGKLKAAMNVAKDFSKAETPLEKRMQANVPANVQAYAIIGETLAENYIDNAYLGLPTKTQSSKGEMLTKLQNEAFVNIVYGRKELDYFDTFAQQWLQAGGEDWTKEVNEGQK